MTDQPKPESGWQKQFDAVQSLISGERFADLLVTSASKEFPPEVAAAMYPTLLQNTMAGAMLAACLQLPQAEAEAALASMARQIRAARFDKPPRDMERELKAIYRKAVKLIQGDLPADAELLQSVFAHYARGDYDAAGDANLLMREAQKLAAARQNARALELAARAGAAALRGRPLWPGWADEGTHEFRHWALALTGVLESHTASGLLPLADVAAERARADERIALLTPPRPVEPDAVPPADLPAEGPPSEAFVKEWLELAGRDEPLTDQEIEELGERYEQFADAAMRVLEMSDSLPDQMPVDMVLEMSAATIGVLRYTDPFAIELLIQIIRNENETSGDQIVQAAVWALQQLGAAALTPAFDFARYSSHDEALEDMLAVLGVVGRGSAEVFDYLATKFLERSWENGKIRYIESLGLLHDERAIPMLADALSDPAIDDANAWQLLDALQELGAELTVDKESRAVQIAGYGVIDDAAPDGWMSRAEEEAFYADTDGMDGDDDDLSDDEDDDLSDDEDDDDSELSDDEDEIEYDAQGIARCPHCGARMQYIGGKWSHPPMDFGPLSRKGMAPLMPPPAPKPVRVEKVGRNDPCPCGSGKKYKYCHGKPGAEEIN